MLQGFATIAANRGLALITALGVVQTFVRGCLTVFVVVVAIDLLGTGDAGVGVLTAAIGAGGILGSFLAFGLVGRGRLATWCGRRRRAVRGAAGGHRPRPRPGDDDPAARRHRDRQRPDRRGGIHAARPPGRRAGPGTHVRGLRGDPHARRRGRRSRHPAGRRPARRASCPRGDRAARAAGRGRQLARAAPARCRGARARRGHRDHASVRMLGALPMATIEQLAGALEHADFEPGQTVFRQGERGEYFYIVRVRPGGRDPRWPRRQDARDRRLLRRDRAVA